MLFNGQLDAKGAAAPYERSYQLGYGNAGDPFRLRHLRCTGGKVRPGSRRDRPSGAARSANATVFRNAGFLEYAARDFAAAESQFRAALAIHPSRARRAGLGDVALARGDIDAARAHFLEESDLASRLRGLAIVDMKSGNARSAEVKYAGLIKEGGDTVHYQQAQVLAQWDRKDAALTQLEQALARRDAGLVRLRNDPLPTRSGRTRALRRSNRRSASPDQGKGELP